jgi:hypothetical protein
MLYDSTKVLLSTLIQSLQASDDIPWDAHIESCSECLFEIHQMARPLYKGYRIEGMQKAQSLTLLSERANRAIPHLKLMVRAIRRKDSVNAITSGKAALSQM